ncbi:MAG: DUF4157 domain-containing protein [Gammaproteobacteria bacterium]|nr:DUF4157 domain-containing protein [Gammaproteobacteria bacterium]
MAFALMSRSRSKTPVSVAPKQKAARAQHSADSRFGFEKPVFQPQTEALPTIQTKLKVGEPDEKFEQEADRVADAVMRMPNGTVRSTAPLSVKDHRISALNGPVAVRYELPLKPSSIQHQNIPVLMSEQVHAPQIQRLCPECEEELRRQPEEKEEEEDEEKLQTNEDSGRANEGASDLESKIGNLRGGGEPLPQSLRAFFEPRFGRDFSEVRVHTDAKAAESTRAVNALAYTVGQNIVFGAGQYVPRATQSIRLLAHELAHVIQQSRGTGSWQGKVKIGEASSHYEREADTVAEQVTHGQKASVILRLSEATAQRTMICSKPLEVEIPGLDLGHAYIDDTGRDDCMGANEKGNYAVTGDLPLSQKIRGGCVPKTNVSPDPRGKTPLRKRCNPRSDVEDLHQCLLNAYKKYPDLSEYSNLRTGLALDIGPNSNTFAGTLARACCEDGSSSGLHKVPGWYHPPAGPCPVVQECLPPPDPLGEWATERWLCEMRLEPPGSNRRLLALASTGPAQGRSVELLHQVLIAWQCTHPEAVKDGLPVAEVEAAEYRDGTTRVVRDFQRWAGVSTDGIVGPITIKKLDAFVGGPTMSVPCGERHGGLQNMDSVGRE